MSKQSEEMKRYFAYHHIRNKDIADMLGIKPPIASNMLAGRDSLGKGRCNQLHETFGFDLRFLMTGEGSLVPDITMTPDQLKRMKPVEEKTPATTIAPPMVDTSADTVSILIGQVQQLTSIISQMRAENLALREELNGKSIG